MAGFTDEKGRKWELTAGPVLNTTSATRVRDTLGVDVFKLFADEAAKVFSDPRLLVDVLYVLCADQCKTQGISDREFGEGMVGDALERAADALMDAVADFFPRSKRTTLQAIKAKGKEISQSLEAALLARVQAVDATGLIEPMSSPAS